MYYGRGILRRDLGCDSVEMLSSSRGGDGLGREVIAILIAGMVLARSIPPPEMMPAWLAFRLKCVSPCRVTVPLKLLIRQNLTNSIS